MIAGFLSFSAFKFNLIYKFFYREQKSERKLCRTDLLDYRDFQRSRFFFFLLLGQIKNTLIGLKKSKLWKLCKVDVEPKDL